MVNDLLNEAYAGEWKSSLQALHCGGFKTQGHEKITEKAQGQLIEFFEYPFIKIVNADREVCELARGYVWKHGMKSKDAVHMATADVAGRVIDIHGIFSWDGDFVNLNGN